MDPFSIVAAVGSFMVSERLLPPKSLLIAGMSFLFIYDLVIFQHDYASLRVYRGPGLLAFTLCCIAYSLRTWRRNGIACDELLFLPGTIYADKFIENQDLSSGSTTKDSLETFRKSVPKNTSKSNLSSSEEEIIVFQNEDNTNDGDDAMTILPDDIRVKEEEDIHICIEVDNEMSSPIADNIIPEIKNRNRSRSFNSNSTMEDIILTANSIEEKDGETDNKPTSTNNEETINTKEEENDNEGYGYTYSPSAPSVFGASLDIAFPVLFNFHLFTEAKLAQTNPQDMITNILPLIFLTVLYFRSIIPPSSRGRFWSVVCCTISAPYYKISLRDEILGDIITSFVRSIQDFIFTFFYYYVVIRSCLYPSEYSLTRTNDYLDKNWLLHCIVLPILAIAPLWWKFVQCLRNVYDKSSTKGRSDWKVKCHAFKYLISTMIVLHSLTHPLNERRILWFIGFGLVTLYQIYCDCFLDWELFVFQPHTASSSQEDYPRRYSYYTISSLSSPTCYYIYRFIIQPIHNIRYNISYIYNSMYLRPNRLFKEDYWYYIIFWFNAITRCCWMMNFLPTHYIDYNSPGKIQIVRTFSKDFNAYLGMMVSVIEIIRRCLWCILVVELESIKLTDASFKNTRKTSTSYQIYMWLFSPMIYRMYRKFGVVADFKYKMIDTGDTIKSGNDVDDENDQLQHENTTANCNTTFGDSSVHSIGVDVEESLSNYIVKERQQPQFMNSNTATTPRTRGLLLILELSCWIGIYIYFGYVSVSH